VHNAKYSALGTLRNEDRCLHVPNTLSKVKLKLLLVSCYHVEITQWHLNRETGQLSTGTKHCLGVSISSLERPQITLEPCLSGKVKQRTNHTQRWLRRDTQLLHAGTHLCLDNPLKDQVEISSCRPQATSQSFQFALEMEAQTWACQWSWNWDWSRELRLGCRLLQLIKMLPFCANLCEIFPLLQLTVYYQQQGKY